MIKLNTEKRHIITVSDPVTGATLTYETLMTPTASVNKTIKTIRALQNGNPNPNLRDKYKGFLNSPVERLEITVTQNYKFQFGHILPPHLVAKVINTHKQQHAKNQPLIDANLETYTIDLKDGTAVEIKSALPIDNFEQKVRSLFGHNFVKLTQIQKCAIIDTYTSNSAGV